MELNSFRELLIKKTDDKNIQFLAKYIKNDILTDLVVESLEKMATMGNSAKDVLTSWAGNSTDEDHHMLHDAMSHHVTRYNAALKAGDRDSADKHLERSVHLMHFAGKAMKHSDLKFEHVPMKAWEMNYTGDERNPNGKFKAQQEGLGRRLTKTGVFTNYRYLEDTPHQSYLEGKAGKKVGEHVGAYPFEETKINGDHIHIDHDHEHTGGYEEHEFDSHPMFNKSGKKTKLFDKAWETGLPEGQEHIDNHDSAVADWDNSVPEKYGERHDALEESDPDGYSMRGKQMSEGIGSKKEKLYSKFDKKPGEEDDEESVEQPEETQSEPEEAVSESTQEQPQGDTELSDEHKEKHADLISAADRLPPHLKEKLLSQIKSGEYDE